MKQIDVHALSADSSIYIGESLENLETYSHGKRLIIITDKNVSRFHAARFPKNAEVITIGFGDHIKVLETVESIYQQMLDLDVDRSWYLVGIGGGVVCDLAGFVAATYMRGLPFGFVSSTLLSQVDASVGGKNGFNFYGYKNIIGLFKQPEFVICDIDMLKTLQGDELINGCAEVVKHAAIADAELFSYLEDHVDDIIAVNPQVLTHIVHTCVAIKAKVVEQDETEKGLRRILNFGHTFGHAVEISLCIPHGEAVSVGMALAAQLSVNRQLLDPNDAQRLKELLEKLGLPTAMMVDKESIRDAIRRDKKREGEGIHFVLLRGIGDVVVQEIPIKELEATIDDLFKYR